MKPIYELSIKIKLSSTKQLETAFKDLLDHSKSVLEFEQLQGKRGDMEEYWPFQIEYSTNRIMDSSRPKTK